MKTDSNIGKFVKTKNNSIAMRIGSIQSTGNFRCYWFDLFTYNHFQKTFYENEIVSLFYKYNGISSANHSNFNFSTPYIRICWFM